jgi:hypothetical protein
MYRLSPLPPQSQSQQHRHYSQQQQSLSTLPRPASAALSQSRLKLENAEYSKGRSDRIAKMQATFDAAAAEHEENMRLTNQCLEDHRIEQEAAWAEQQQAAYEQFHPEEFPAAQIDQYRVLRGATRQADQRSLRGFCAPFTGSTTATTRPNSSPGPRDLPPRRPPTAGDPKPGDAVLHWRPSTATCRPASALSLHSNQQDETPIAQIFGGGIPRGALKRSSTPGVRDLPASHRPTTAGSCRPSSSQSGTPWEAMLQRHRSAAASRPTSASAHSDNFWLPRTREPVSAEPTPNDKPFFQPGSATTLALDDHTQYWDVLYTTSSLARVRRRPTEPPFPDDDVVVSASGAVESQPMHDGRPAFGASSPERDIPPVALVATCASTPFDTTADDAFAAETRPAAEEDKGQRVYALSVAEVRASTLKEKLAALELEQQHHAAGASLRAERELQARRDAEHIVKEAELRREQLRKQQVDFEVCEALDRATGSLSHIIEYSRSHPDPENVDEGRRTARDNEAAARRIFGVLKQQDSTLRRSGGREERLRRTRAALQAELESVHLSRIAITRAEVQRHKAAIAIQRTFRRSRQFHLRRRTATRREVLLAEAAVAIQLAFRCRASGRVVEARRLSTRVLHRALTPVNVQ